MAVTLGLCSAWDGKSTLKGGGLRFWEPRSIHPSCTMYIIIQTMPLIAFDLDYRSCVRSWSYKGQGRSYVDSGEEKGEGRENYGITVSSDGRQSPNMFFASRRSPVKRRGL